MLNQKNSHILNDIQLCFNAPPILLCPQGIHWICPRGFESLGDNRCEHDEEHAHAAEQECANTQFSAIGEGL